MLTGESVILVVPVEVVPVEVVPVEVVPLEVVPVVAAADILTTKVGTIRQIMQVILMNLCSDMDPRITLIQRIVTPDFAECDQREKNYLRTLTRWRYERWL